MIRALAAAALVASCTTAPAPAPINVARTTAPAAERDLDLPANADALMLAFSGGGARAASFSYGVLLGLRDMQGAHGRTRLDDVALVTAVSGGAITAAYFGQHGAAGLDAFAAFLDDDWARDLNTSALAPQNWMRAARGGLNRTTDLADRFDADLYRGARIGDLPARPRVILNAADLYTGAPLAFTPFFFDALCSDVGQVRVADAVAASMAVPLAFQPVLAAPYGQACPAPDWATRALADRSAPSTLRATARAVSIYRAEPPRYLHLVDGGVADNFGLASLNITRAAATNAYAPLTAEDAVRLRRLTVIVVNAEIALSGDWPETARGPNGAAAMGAAFFDSIDAGKRGAYDAFLATSQAWERDLIAWRCALPAAEVRALRGGGDGWRCDDLDIRVEMIAFDDLGPERAAQLGAAPTRVSLPRETIAALIQGGRDAIALSGAPIRP